MMMMMMTTTTITTTTTTLTIIILMKVNYLPLPCRIVDAVVGLVRPAHRLTHARTAVSVSPSQQLAALAFDSSVYIQFILPAVVSVG